MRKQERAAKAIESTGKTREASLRKKSVIAVRVTGIRERAKRITKSGFTALASPSKR
jgi:hypothetical protein